MEQQAPVPRETAITPPLEHKASPNPRQLDLVLHDGRLHAMTPAACQAALSALAHLLLEASGRSIGEASHEHA